MSKTDFYVYVYFRESGEPCYVGKGRGRRDLAHFRRSANPHLRSIIKQSGGTLQVVRVFQHLTEQQAFALEIEMIRSIGRKPDGPLVNMTDGGEGASGARASEETKRKLSESVRSPRRMQVLLKRNRSPENIERLKRLALDPARIAKASAFARSEEHRQRLIALNRSQKKREAVSKSSSRPENVANLVAFSQSEAWRKRRSEMSKDAEHIRKLVEFNRSDRHRLSVAVHNQTEAMREASSRRAKARNSSPEFQAKAREGLLRYFAARRAARNTSGNKV